MRRIPGSLFVLCLLVTAIAARAEEAPSFTLGEALRNSRLIADFRLRFEQVDDDAFTRPAAATTLRSAVGFETGEFRGWQVRLELEDVSVVGADEYANGGFGSANNGVLGRPLIGKLGVEVAARTGCDTLAHGCTGKGNDQVRLEATVAALNPDLKMIAPVRSWQIGRDEELAYCKQHGIPLKGGTSATPFSIDDNLWGRSSEGGTIEHLDTPPPDEVFQLVTRPELAPDEPEMITVGFEKGRPVSINGEAMDLVTLLEKAAEAGCRHGCGIVDHIEDRIVGLKVRDIYEIPAASIILTAHQELEKVVSTIHQNNFKHVLDRKWADTVYAGLWAEPLRTDLDAYMDAANEFATGEITLKLFKGSVTPVARTSPYALYDETLASFGESGGTFSQTASPGFIELFSLQSRMASRIRTRDAKETK